MQQLLPWDVLSAQAEGRRQPVSRWDTEQSAPASTHGSSSAPRESAKASQ